MATIDIQASNGTVLLIDLSYFVFYRYFATFNWYNRQAGTNVDASHIMDDKVFVEKYSKMFEKNIKDLMKAYKVVVNSNVIFAKDCSRDNIWRHRHYDGYKATRDEKTSSTFNKGVFPYTYNVLIPQLKDKIGFQIIGHQSLEADDVIAIITNDALDRGNDVSIAVITNDNDYIQLMNHTCLDGGSSKATLKIKNLQNKNICERVGCSPKEYIKMKKVIGDKSDNIPSIVKKCGEKTAYKLATNEDALAKLFEKDLVAKQQYELNDLLIDFAKIPFEYVQEVKEKLNIT
jgi:5'-3' exonuclease